MSTLLQKQLANEIVKDAKRPLNKRKNKKELMVSAGYDLTSAESTPGKIIAQKGVREELKNLGFSEDGAKKVVEEIMYNKKVDPRARLTATHQVFQVHGSYAPERHEVKTLTIQISKEVAEKYGITPSTENDSQ